MHLIYSVPMNTYELISMAGTEVMHKILELQTPLQEATVGVG